MFPVAITAGGASAPEPGSARGACPWAPWDVTHCAGWPSRTVEVELGGVVLADGEGILLVGEFQRDDRGDDFLRPDHQSEDLAGRTGRLAQAEEVLVGRLDGLLHTFLGLDHPDPGGLEAGEGLRDFGLDPEDDPGEIDRRQLFLGSALADQSDVADASVRELPDGRNLDIHSGAVGIEQSIGTR